MYITVPIDSQKNQRVIFYFAIDQPLEDHPRSASMVRKYSREPWLVDPPESAGVTFPRRSGKENNVVDT